MFALWIWEKLTLKQYFWMGRVWASWNSCSIFVFCFQLQHFTFTNFLSLRSHLIFEEPVIQNEGRSVISCLEHRQQNFGIYFCLPEWLARQWDRLLLNLSEDGQSTMWANSQSLGGIIHVCKYSETLDLKMLLRGKVLFSSDWTSCTHELYRIMWFVQFTWHF